jgi:hypothetical protein
MVLIEVEKVMAAAIGGFEVMVDVCIGCSKDNVARAGARIWLAECESLIL